jgi:hypothetical protein
MASLAAKHLLSSARPSIARPSRMAAATAPTTLLLRVSHVIANDTLALAQ